MRKERFLFYCLFISKKCNQLQQKVFSNKLLLLIPILFMLYPVNLYGDNFKAASDIWTPFFIVSDDHFSGIGVEILTEVVRRTGDTVTFIFVPNKRALKMFDEKDVDMMVIDSPLWSDPCKAESYIFSDNVMTVQEYIYFLTENTIEVKKPSDLSGKTIDIIRGYYYPEFEKAFQKGVVFKSEVSSEASLIKKLVTKRTDAIFMDSIAFRHTIATLGYDPGRFNRGLQLSDTTLGIKIQREKSNILPRINKAIAAMKKDGTIDRIINKYTR